MNAEQIAWIKETWLPALRSGKYEQTSTHLRDQEGYCCLGVACDLLGVDWLEREGEYDARMDEGAYAIQYVSELYRGKLLFEQHVLPKSIAWKIGIRGDGKFEPVYTIATSRTGGQKDVDTLAEMNDAGMTFEEIADFIENVLLSGQGEHEFLGAFA